MIVLLSLKAESKSVLHSVNFQSYPLSIESSSLHPLLRTPSLANPIGHPSPLVLELGQRKIKEMCGKKRSKYPQQSNILCSA